MATLTGTPTVITWAAGANPAGQAITIPGDANRVVMCWSYYANSNGAGLASVTLAGNAPTGTFEVVVVTATTEIAIGMAWWDNPATGSQTLDPAWDAAPSDGPTTTVAYITNADVTGAPRDVDGANGTSTGAVSVTLTTVAADLVIKYDSRFETTPPANTSGWTSVQTETNRNGLSTRLATISAAGATQACPCENESWSGIVAMSMAAAAGGGGTAVPVFRRHYQTIKAN